MYKQPQLGQGTCEYCWWDGWTLGVGTYGWRIVHGWWSKKGVDELGVIEKTGWSKVDVIGIIKWKGRGVSWWSIQVITISEFCCDTHWCFVDNETVGLAITIHIN